MNLNLLERTMQEDYEQLLEDSQTISRFMTGSDEHDLLEGYVYALNQNLSIFQEHHEGKFGFNYLYRLLRRDFIIMAKDVLEKYGIKLNGKPILEVAAR